MKTIQEYLKECNREKIINTYIFKHVFGHQMMSEKYKNITCGEIAEKYKTELNNYIDRLLGISPKKEEETWILMVVHATETEYNSDIRFLLVKQSDVLKEPLDEFITPYGYFNLEFEEILGFYVADTYLTQYYLEDLIVDFLYESSWTGFKHEQLQEMTDSLNEGMEEEGELYTIEELEKELEEKFGIEFEKKDKEQEEAFNLLFKQQAEYNRKCEMIEIKKLRKLLS